MPDREGITPEVAQAILRKLLASPHLSGSRLLSEFLRFITLKTIAGTR
jgi:hypothetical protein